ncbi:hypothetical protein SCHIN_v1c02260 [Spiroplasma chinense]|uniref:Lipoprotein n=1 Tax=Spiroplasma chinense TaxID=216932 RepID=A0A5B9Y3T7_9MOLU|nr:hypothetical protein [Spiroplasma chinense]QEH61423.1 hypothetical protein SCHIN_v1c02260 [Spiroplasma chinense]
MKKILLKLLSATVLIVPTSLAVSCVDPKHYSGPEPEETYWWQDYEIEKFDSAKDFLKANFESYILKNIKINNRDLESLNDNPSLEKAYKIIVNSFVYDSEARRNNYIWYARESFGEREDYQWDLKDKKGNYIFNAVYNKGTYGSGSTNEILKENFEPLNFNPYKEEGDEKVSAFTIWNAYDMDNILTFKQFGYLEVRVYQDSFLWNLNPEEGKNFERFFIAKRKENGDPGIYFNRSDFDKE